MPKGYPHRIEETMGYVPPPAEKPVITFDDVEDEEWFQRLPSAAQQDYRDRWAKADARHDERLALSKTTRSRSMIQAGLVFLFTESCCAIPNFWHSLAGAVAGVAVGLYWHRIGAGRFRCMITSVLPYAALRVAFVDASSQAALILSCITAVVGFLMLLSLTAGVGFVRERRRADDLDF